jgi:predicted RNase H-like nuclease (RuvC/YqgF family)
MSALDRLKEKVEAWKQRIDELEQANQDLKAQLEHLPQRDDDEAGSLREALEVCQERVAVLEKDIVDKDREIDAIIAKVEAMIA